MFLQEYFVHQPMLDIDPPRISACKIPNQFFIGRRSLEWVFLQNSN